MRILAVVAVATLLALGGVDVPSASAAQSELRSVVGVVRSYDPTTGRLLLQDGTSLVIPNDPGHQLPSGLTSPPFVGQSVRVTYRVINGQSVVTILEAGPDTAGDLGGT